jgi:hypothetical protein
MSAARVSAREQAAAPMNGTSTTSARRANRG